MSLPDSPDDFLNLEGEQQANALLADLAVASPNQRGTNLILFQLESWFRALTTGTGDPQTFTSLRQKRSEAEDRLRDAYSLLESRNLIRPKPRQPNFCVITPAGEAHLEAIDQPDEDRVSFARRALAAFDLHEALQRQEVQSHFLQGKFETAIRDGSVYAEDAIRTIAGMPAGLSGVRLASQAFAVGGPLADPGRLPGDQTAIQHLFIGYAGAIRNLVGHQAFRYGTNKKAFHHLMLLDQLTEELDDAATRLGISLP